MQFPTNLVLLGASAIAVVALVVSGRFLVATAREMGNPDLDQAARRFMGYWAMAVAIAMLSVGTAVTIIVHPNGRSPSQEPIEQEGEGDGTTLPDKPTTTALSESNAKPALVRKR